MSERKTAILHAKVEPTLREAVETYIKEEETTISEMVRACVMNYMLDQGYLSQEQLEMMLI